MAVKEEKGEQVIENVEVALEKTGDFFEKHKSVIITVVAVIVLLVIGYFGYKYLYLAPKERPPPRKCSTPNVISKWIRWKTR